MEGFASSINKYMRFTAVLRPSAPSRPRLSVFVAAAGDERGGSSQSAEPATGQCAMSASEQRIATLRSHTVGWIAVAGLMLRTVAVPISVANIPGMLHSLSAWSVSVVITISVVNLALTGLAANGRLASKWDSKTFFALDMVFTAALTVWAAYLVPSNALLGADRDVMSLYALATVALWTSARGWRQACAVVAGGTALNVLLPAVRGSDMYMSAVLQLVGRTGWLIAGLAVPLVITLFAQRTARLGDASGLQFGYAVQRAEALRELHDTALQSFGQAAQRSGDARVPVGERLANIKAFAAEQSADLRVAMAGVADAQKQNLVGNLQHVAQAFTSRGLTVTVQSCALKVEPPDLAAHVLLGAVREALNNVLKHAGVDHAIVLVSSRGSTLSIGIEDDGVGFTMEADSHGYGIPNSVRRRIHDLGGAVGIHSSPGKGTKVTLTLPVGRRGVWLRAGVAGKTQVRVGEDASLTFDEFVTRALNWFAVPALAYRICISLIQATMAISALGIGVSVYFAAVMLLVLAGDLVILLGLAAGRMRGLLRSKLYFAVDVWVAAGLNLWVAYALPRGTLLLPGHEVFWDYVLGVVAFWVALRGPRLGVAMIVGGSLLQLLMARVNRAPLVGAGWSVILAQLSLLVMALLIAWAIRALAFQGASLAVAEGVRAGREAERAEVLRAYYESSLAALGRIEQVCSADSTTDLERLLTIRGIALRQADVLRDRLVNESTSSEGRLVIGLEKLKDEFRGLGVRVELVTAELSTEPTESITNALLGATREALHNIRQHSNSVHAVVRAAGAEHGVEIIIRDQGLGFDPGGHDGSRIKRWLDSVGGTVTIQSAPGMGTRVRLFWVASNTV